MSTSKLNRLDQNPRTRLYKCPECVYVSRFPQGLAYHSKHHLSSKPYTCSCGYGCLTKQMLAAHMTSLHSPRQYKCVDCDYETSSQTKLQDHIDAFHKGDCRFRCFECDVVFSRKVERKRHLDTVHGSEKYKCGCGRSFGRKDSLLRHQKKTCILKESGLVTICA